MFKKVISKARALTSRHPRLTIALMCAAMLASFCSLLHGRIYRPIRQLTSTEASVQLLAPLGQSVSGIISSAASLSELLELQQSLEHMLAKETLNAADSVRIERALDRMQQLQTRLTGPASRDTLNPKTSTP